MKLSLVASFTVVLAGCTPSTAAVVSAVTPIAVRIGQDVCEIADGPDASGPEWVNLVCVAIDGKTKVQVSLPTAQWKLIQAEGVKAKR